MISEEKENRIMRLLSSDKYSVRQIALMTNSDRETVNCRKKNGKKKRSEKLFNRKDKSDLTTNREPNFSSHIDRCSECGCKVYIPCMSCRLKADLKRNKKLNSTRKNCNV